MNFLYDDSDNKILFMIRKLYSLEVELVTEEHRYTMKSQWIRDKIVTIEIDGKDIFEVATPRDFWPESPSGVLSPEDLFVASVASCYGASLSGVSKRFHAEFNDFLIKALGTLKKGEFGWEFDEVTLDVHITVSTDKDRKRMEKVAERAHRYCLVGNSLKCPVKLKYEVIVE
jgi:organic hydroperoxide reductase OsmC/OhrA